MGSRRRRSEGGTLCGRVEDWVGTIWNEDQAVSRTSHAVRLRKQGRTDARFYILDSLLHVNPSYTLPKISGRSDPTKTPVPLNPYTRPRTFSLPTTRSFATDYTLICVSYSSRTHPRMRLITQCVPLLHSSRLSCSKS